MSNSEVWSVALAPDNIQTLSLDQLDAAFQKGLINEATLVWTEGMDSWQRIGEVLSEDEPAAPAVQASAFPPVAQTAVAQATAAQATVAQATVARAPVVRTPVASVPPQAVAPQTAAAQALPNGPLSTAPVAFNLNAQGLDLPDIDEGFGTKKKSKWGFIAAAAVVVAGVGVTAANLSSGVSNADPVQAAAAARPLAEGEQPLAAAADAPLEGGGYKVSAAEEKKFKAEEERNKELREKMAAALANNPPEEPKKSSAGARKTYRPKKSGDDTGIKKGGSKFDPLNGSLP